MSQYDKKIFDSDLSAFKNSGQILNAAVAVSGTLGASAQKTFSTQISFENPDMAQFLFDNSRQHSGKFKSVIIERITMVKETTFGSYLTAALMADVSGNTVTLSVVLINAYGSAVNLESTTINFRYIPYEATF